LFWSLSSFWFLSRFFQQAFISFLEDWILVHQLWLTTAIISVLCLPYLDACPPFLQVPNMKITIKITCVFCLIIFSVPISDSRLTMC
jgi:hypothetical protein